MADFNKNCDKPYYVEMSAGLCSFICDTNTNLLEMLNKSDEVLYEKKKMRRATIKK